jgi:hypothetical protein
MRVSVNQNIPGRVVLFNAYHAGDHMMILHCDELKKKDVRFEVFTAVTMKNGVFWNVTPCGSCKNRRFGGT